MLVFDLTTNISRQPAVACVHLARLQRAPEGSDQSTTSGCDDVVNRRGVAFRELLCAESVVLCNSAMHTEDYGLCLTRQVRQPDRAGAPLNARRGTLSS